MHKNKGSSIFSKLMKTDRRLLKPDKLKPDKLRRLPHKMANKPLKKEQKRQSNKAPNNNRMSSRLLK